MLRSITRAVLLTLVVFCIGATVATAACQTATEFPGSAEKYAQHGKDFPNLLGADAYRLAALDRASGAPGPGREHCEGNNGRTLYWDGIEMSITIISIWGSH